MARVQFFFLKIPIPNHKPRASKTSKKPNLVAEFTLPLVYECQETVFFRFKTSIDMKLCVGRAHIWYEKTELKGPLKGVNMPIEILLSWRENANNVTVNEQLVIDFVVGNPKYRYFIAHLNGDSSTVLHEWCHAYYYFNQEYRDLVSELWESLPIKTRNHVNMELKMRNYHTNVYLDEFQAYVRENPMDFGKKWASDLQDIHLLLKSLIKPPILDKIELNLQLESTLAVSI